jgi:phage shock protein A
VNVGLAIAIVGLAGVVVTAVLAYRGDSRTHQGKVDTSAPGEIWAAAENMLNRYKERIDELEAKAVAQDLKLAAQDQKLIEVEAVVRNLEEQIARIGKAANGL